MLLQEEFRALTEARSPEPASSGGGVPLASIYLPTARVGPGVAEGPIRLKKLLAAVREDGGAGLDLAPLEALLADDVFWNHQGEGLALFVGPREVVGRAGFVEHRLPVAVEELAVVGPRFDLRPLLGAVARGPGFHVLALSQNSVRLFAGAGARLREVSLAGSGVPARLEDAVGWDWSAESLQFRSGAGARGVDGAGHAGAGAGAGAMYHGHGDVGDRKDELRRFLVAVDRGLAEVIDDPSAPLVVAAVDFVAAMFAEVSRVGGARRGEVVVLDGNVERMGEAELAEAAFEAVRPALEARDRAWLDELREVGPVGKVALGVTDVLWTGAEGRHRVLFVDPAAEVWGRLLDGNGRAEVDEVRGAGSDDLLDAAWRMAWACGAEIVPVRAEELPGGVPVAALLRH